MSLNELALEEPNTGQMQARHQISALEIPYWTTKLDLYQEGGTPMVLLRMLSVLAFATIVLVACEHKNESTPVVVGQADGPVAVAVKPTMQDPKNFNEPDQTACSEFGGTYQQAGLLGYFNCFVAYDDGGKTCSDASDCQGNCFATAAVSFDPDAVGGQTGTCAVNDSPFGCRSEIINGVVQPGTCVD